MEAHMFDNVMVKDWMVSPVITVDSSSPISSAHQLMKKHGVRRLPVLHNDKLVGIVTIGDVREASPSDATTLSIWELNYLWAQLTVEKVMTRNPMSIASSTPILEAAEVMLDKKVSGLPVVDEGKLVGILTESDIFRMLVTSRAKQTV
jgi:CBS domain-containing protein